MDDLSGKSFRKRWAIRIGVALSVLVLATVALWGWREYRIARLLAQIRAAGEPVTPEELNAYYGAPPPDVDATALWLEAFVLEQAMPFDEAFLNLPIVGFGDDVPSELPEIGRPWPDLQLAERFLAQRENVLKLLHQAAALGGRARYPKDFRDEYKAPYSNLSDTRTSARLLLLEALVRAHRGDADGAARSILGIFALARSFENEPCLISQIVRAAVTGSGAKFLERFAGQAEFSERSLERLQGALRAPSYSEGFYRGLLGARVFGIMAFEDPSEIGLTAGAAAIARVFGRADCEHYLASMDRMVRASRRSLHEALADAQSFDDRLPRSWDVFGSTRFGIEIARVGGMIEFPSYAIPALARIAARNSVADAGLGVERFRLRHNRLPDNLDALVPDLLPEVPTDPFTGQPIRYRIVSGGFVVYSVGEDRVDNGGLDEGPNELDINFRVRFRQSP